MTDRQSPGSKYHEALQVESEEYDDLSFQNLKGGWDFYLRFLNHVVYTFFNYQFDYLLRLDDDYYFCMEKFLGEVPIPMQREFHWGFVHCESRSVRPDESTLLFSKDILIRFLSQDQSSMKCAALADLSIGYWVQDLGLKNFFRHDQRLYHDPPVPKNPRLKSENNICSKYIGIHGSYPNDTRSFWNRRGQLEPNSKTGDLKTNSRECRLSGLNYKALPRRFTFKPKLCVNMPTWDTMQTQEDGSYIGREEDIQNDKLKKNHKRAQTYTKRTIRRRNIRIQSNRRRRSY